MDNIKFRLRRMAVLVGMSIVLFIISVGVYFFLKTAWSYFFIDAYNVYKTGHTWGPELLEPLFKGCFFLFWAFIISTYVPCLRASHYAEVYKQRRAWEENWRRAELRRGNSVLAQCNKPSSSTSATTFRSQ